MCCCDVLVEDDWEEYSGQRIEFSKEFQLFSVPLSSSDESKNDQFVLCTLFLLVTGLLCTTTGSKNSLSSGPEQDHGAAMGESYDYL